MPINGCCGFRFVVWLSPLHAQHSPPRPSCMGRKYWPNSLTIPHLAHCLHHARRVGFCHHLALSNSGSCCPLQQPGKSRTGISIWIIRRSPVRFLPNPRQLKSIWIWANRPSSKGSKLLFPEMKANKIKTYRICRRAASLILKDSAKLGFCWLFWSLYAHLPETWTSPCPSPICASAICRSSPTFPTKLVPIVCVLTATCSPSRLCVAASFLTGRLLSLQPLQYCILQAHSLHSSPIFELDPENIPRPTSNGCRQRALFHQP